jgi:hypothetical protein
MTKDILSIYSIIKYSKFQVIYSNQSIASSTFIYFMINSSLLNGNCSIDPFNGTITTLFTINYFNWFDQHGIKDYSFYSNILFLFKSLMTNIFIF